MTRDALFKTLTYFIMLLAAAVVVLSYIGTLQLQTEVTRQQAVVRCQLVYANEFQKAISVRDQANRVIRESQIELLKAATSQDNTDLALFVKNIESLERANATIKANPLPRVNFCDGV